MYEVAHLEQISLFEQYLKWERPGLKKTRNIIIISTTVSLSMAVNVHLRFVRKVRLAGSRQEEEKCHLYEDCYRIWDCSGEDALPFKFSLLCLLRMTKSNNNVILPHFPLLLL